MMAVNVKVRTEKENKARDLEGSLTRRIELPAGWGLLSHLDNIEYGIEQIKKYSREINNPVIGYVLVRGLGTREALHRILPQKRAEKLKKDKERRFDYFILKELLEEKKAYKEGKYRVNEEGYFVDLNTGYSD